MSQRNNLMIIAGEVSGDMHAAAIVRVIRRQAPDIRFFGIGGPELRREGMEIFFDSREMAVLGLNEVLRKYFFFRRVFKTMLDLARERRPDAILLSREKGNQPLQYLLQTLDRIRAEITAGRFHPE